MLIISQSVQSSLKAIFKYSKYPSIPTINEAFPNNYFTLSIIRKKDIIDQIKRLNQKGLPEIMAYL